MGVTKTILVEGAGAIPQTGQTVIIEYTGWLKDVSKPNNKGDKYVSCFLAWIRSQRPGLVLTWAPIKQVRFFSWSW